MLYNEDCLTSQTTHCDYYPKRTMGPETCVVRDIATFEYLNYKDGQFKRWQASLVSPGDEKYTHITLFVRYDNQEFTAQYLHT